MFGWQCRLNGHEFQQVPGVGDGQGGLACCIPWGRKEWDTTEGWREHYELMMCVGDSEFKPRVH